MRLLFRRLRTQRRAGIPADDPEIQSPGNDPKANSHLPRSDRPENRHLPGVTFDGINFEGINFEGIKSSDGLDSRHEEEIPDRLPSAVPHRPASNIWSMYLKRADAFDDSFVESCREDMESLLLFSAIFSAAGTAFVIESYQKLQPDSGDLSAMLLLRISEQLSSSIDVSLLPPLQTTFHPTRAAIFYNTCWFSSLVFSIGCSLGAIMVRQWVLNYSQHIRDETTLPRRTRMRQYLFEGVETWKMGTFVEVLSGMLHFALFLFVVGLIAFLSEANTIVMAMVSVLIILAIISYAILTYLPVRWPDCPYQTPLSAPCLSLYSMVTYYWRTSFHQPSDFQPPIGLHERRKLALSGSTDRDALDARALRWLLKWLTEGRDVIGFLAAIPQFIDSFSLGEREVFAPQTIVLEAGSKGLGRLLESCMRKDGNRQTLKPSMKGSALVCLDTLLFLARAPPSRREHPNWTKYFGSSMWSTLRTLRLDPSPDIAVRASCALTTIITQQLDRSNAVERLDNSIASTRFRLYEELGGWNDRAPDHRSASILSLSDCLWKECWLEDRALGLFCSTLPLESDDLPVTLGRGGDTCHDDLPLPFKEIAYLYQGDYLFALVGFFARFHARGVTEDERRTALAVVGGLADRIRDAFPPEQGENDAHFAWFFQRLGVEVSLRFSDLGRQGAFELDVLVHACSRILFDNADQTRGVFENYFRVRVGQVLGSSTLPLLDIVNSSLEATVLSVAGEFRSRAVAEFKSRAESRARKLNISEGIAAE